MKTRAPLSSQGVDDGEYFTERSQQHARVPGLLGVCMCVIVWVHD